MLRDLVEKVLGRIVKEQDLALLRGIAAALLAQILDHTVVCGFVDEGDHHLLPVDLVGTVLILGCGRLGYLPDILPGQHLRHTVAQLFHISLVDVAALRRPHKGHGIGIATDLTFLQKLRYDLTVARPVK